MAKWARDSISCLEIYPFSCPPVDGRGRIHPIAIAAQAIGTQGVDTDDEDVISVKWPDKENQKANQAA